MKRIFKNFMALSLGLALVAAGCSKDEDYAKDIEGTYVGTLTSPAVGINILNVPIIVTRTGQNNVTLNLSQNIVGLNIDATCNSTVEKNGDTYKVSGTTTVTVIPNVPTATVEVEISGSITKGTAQLEIVVQFSDGLKTALGEQGAQLPNEAVISFTGVKN